jgi:hypothetical protein
VKGYLQTGHDSDGNGMGQQHGHHFHLRAVRDQVFD